MSPVERAMKIQEIILEGLEWRDEMVSILVEVFLLFALQTVIMFWSPFGLGSRQELFDF
jgi:hypothetical protein